VSRKFTEARLFLGLFGVQVLIGAALALTHINLITLLIGTQVLQGIVTPVILVFILILTNRRSVLGNAANKPVFKVVATVCVAGISTMSLLLLGTTVLGFLGIGGPGRSHPRSGIEAVAHPGLGEQVTRTRRLRLELAPQLGDVDAQVVALGLIRRPPPLLEELTLGDQAAAVAHQDLQQLPFGGGQPDIAAVG